MAKNIELVRQEVVAMRNEVEDFANSAERVGGVVSDVLEYGHEQLTDGKNKHEALAERVTVAEGAISAEVARAQAAEELINQQAKQNFWNFSELGVEESAKIDGYEIALTKKTNTAGKTKVKVPVYDMQDPSATPAGLVDEIFVEDMKAESKKMVDAEAERAEAKEQKIEGDLATEAERAKSAEGTIMAKALDNAGRITALETASATKAELTAEAERASKAEKNIATLVQQNAGKIKILEDVSATKVELNAEAERAHSAEKVNADAIAAEVERAEAKEQEIEGKVTELESDVNTLPGMMINSPDFVVAKESPINILENIYLNESGEKIDYNGFRVCVCKVVPRQRYFITGTKFVEGHCNFLFANDSELQSIVKIINDTFDSNGISTIHIPDNVNYLAWDEYPAVDTTIRTIIPCNQKIKSVLNEENVFGYITEKFTLISDNRQYIKNGNIVPTSEYDLRVTKPLKVGFGKVSIERTSNVAWAEVCGYRFLAEDGESVIAFGTISGDNAILSYDIPYGACYFQISEYATTIQNIEVKYIAETPINVLDGKLYGNVYGGGIIPTTCYIYQDKIRNDDIYNLYTSTPIDVSRAEKIKLISNVDFQSVFGYRFLAEDGESVVSFGVLPNGGKEVIYYVPNGAVYFQFSGDKDLVLNARVYANIVKMDVLNNANSKSFISKTKGYSVQTDDSVILQPNEQIHLLPSNITCRDWISAISMNGDSIDATLIYGNDYGKSSLRITETEIVETELSHSFTKRHTHGLIFGKNVHLMLEVKQGKTFALLMSNGNQYKVELSVFYGTNGLSAKNNSTNPLTIQRASIDLTASINAQIILCGDSYAFEAWGVDEDNTEKYGWVSILKNMGCKFANFGFPGANSGNLILMLNEIISAGARPSIIIWAMGMNDGTDTSSDYGNNTWREMINKACAAAISVGATFIPCTIPSVPNITHKGKNNYIKTNFSRYIDFDDALIDGSDWIDGYLSSDNVHPTADGFFAMATEVIKDVPEFFEL